MTSRVAFLSPSMAVLPLLAVLTACFPLTGGKSVVVPAPDPPRTERKVPDVQPAMVTADVVYPIRWIQSTADATIPTLVHAAHAWTYAGDRLRFRFAVHRRPVMLSGAGNAITLSAPFVYKFKVGYRLIGGWGPEGSCAWASDDAFDPPAVGGDVAVSTAFTPRGDWSIESKSSIAGLAIGACPITIAGVDISGLIRKVVGDNLGGQLSAIDNQVRPQLQFAAQAAKFWAEAQKPIPLNANAALTLAPSTAIVSPVIFTNDSLYARVGLAVKPTFWAGTPPTPTAETPLPLLQVGTPDPGFAVRASVVASDSAITAALERKVVGRRLDRKVGPFRVHARVSKVRFYGVGDTAIVAIDLAGRLRGTLFAIGVPAYNAATRQFTVRDLALTTESTNLLAKVGFSHAKAALLDSLRAATTLDLGKEIDETMAALNSLGNQDLKGFRLEAALNELTPLGIFRRAEGFAVLVDMRGTARLIGLTPRAVAPVGN